MSEHHIVFLIDAQVRTTDTAATLRLMVDDISHKVLSRAQPGLLIHVAIDDSADRFIDIFNNLEYPHASE